MVLAIYSLLFSRFPFFFFQIQLMSIFPPSCSFKYNISLFLPCCSFKYNCCPYFLKVLERFPSGSLKTQIVGARWEGKSFPILKKTLLARIRISVSSSWDKLTLATEEGTKLVCSALFFLAFYKDRYKNRHGKMRRLFT